MNPLPFIRYDFPPLNDEERGAEEIIDKNGCMSVLLILFIAANP
jgi:hypothetical protein